MIWESLGVLPAPAPSPTPTPEGAALKAQVKLRFGNPQEEDPDPGSSSAQEETEPRFPDSWDTIMESWDSEAAALEMAYPIHHSSDEEDVRDNCHG